MTTLHIETDVTDFATWKKIFDSDPAQRQQNGVRAYRVGRGADKPNHVVMDLDFDDTGAARQFLNRLREVWTSQQGKSVLTGPPQVEVVEMVEDRKL